MGIMEKFSLPSSKLICYSKRSESVSAWRGGWLSLSYTNQCNGFQGERWERHCGMPFLAMFPSWGCKSNSHLLLWVANQVCTSSSKHCVISICNCPLKSSEIPVIIPSSSLHVLRCLLRGIMREENRYPFFLLLICQV